jgi:hypothetical protein
VIGVLVILALLILTGLTYANHNYTTQNPGGNDFLSRWVGTRLFLTRGLSPYSEQVTRQIHEMAYGRVAQATEDQMLFAYPFHAALVIAPFALVEEYAMARALWMTAAEVLLILIAASGIYLSRWRLPPWLLALVLLFAVFWYHGLRPVINGNPSVFVTLFICLALMAIRSEQDPLAGFLLALATIKPQMVALLIPLILLWATSHRRWSLVGSFLGSLILLIAAFSLFIPDWILQNLRQVLSYPRYTLPSTPGAILMAWLPGVGRQLGWGISALMAAVILWEWRLVLGQDFRWLFWTSCLTLVITNLIGIQTATENYVAMFPALVLIFSIWEERWRLGRWLVLASMLLLLLGLWYLFLNTLQTGDQPIQSPVMFFPLPLLLLAGLYWVRWWAINPPRVFLDQLREASSREQI